MTKDELKRRVWEAIDRRGPEIIGLGEQIRRHPELGFKEVETARLVEETLKKLGLAPRASPSSPFRRRDTATSNGAWARRARGGSSSSAASPSSCGSATSTTSTSR